MIRFQAPQFPPVEAVAAYFARAEEERWYSNGGPCYLLLVDRLEDYLGHGVRCVPLANCTLALALGLRALTGPERERQEVLMPSFTFAAVASAAIWAGLQPVFVDIDALTWHLCPEALTDALSQRGAVGAFLACSTFGVPPPISVRRQWEATALEAGVPLLVDSAAGFGSMDEQGQRLGHQGQAEVFSFHATKPFAIGEGGLLATRDQRIASHVSRLANFGWAEKFPALLLLAALLFVGLWPKSMSDPLHETLIGMKFPERAAPKVGRVIPNAPSQDERLPAESLVNPTPSRLATAAGPVLSR
jgi:dTDP-4-amino-4,6-dideoxygalactose transaminase